MSKIVLMMFLCVSLQGCSNGAGSSKSEDPSTIGKTAKTAKEKKPDKNGLLAITQFMAVMAVLKTQVD